MWQLKCFAVLLDEDDICYSQLGSFTHDDGYSLGLYLYPTAVCFKVVFGVIAARWQLQTLNSNSSRRLQ